MIIVTQCRSIVNFDNVTYIDVSNQDGVFSVFAGLPYLLNYKSDSIVLGKYDTLKRAREQIEFIACSFQRDKKYI